jgi:ABC-type polysaccharide/polyol phosphate transport system ATPase subunit
MASVHLENVGVEFAIHNSVSRSLRHELYRVVGGTVKTQNRAVWVEALKNISFSLKDGDRLALLGHNGAGKTTLLRVIAGIYPPTSGRIEVTGRRSSMTDITMGMDTEMTGRDNIVARLVLMGYTFTEAKRLVPQIAEFSELGDYLMLPARTYSTGMFMRLAFAIATSTTPEILILDEMLGAGDAHFVEKARERLLEFVDRAKIMVLAAHNQAMLKEYCKQAIWLHHGEMRFFTTVDAAWAAYVAAPSGIEPS